MCIYRALFPWMSLPSKTVRAVKSPRMGITQKEGSWVTLFFPVLSFLLCSFLLNSVGPPTPASGCGEGRTSLGTRLQTRQ